MRVKLRFIDAHTHVHFKAYDSDRDEVINRALSSGIGMVNVGTDKKTSLDAISIAETKEGLWATVGLHPIHTSPSFHDEDEGDDASEIDFDYEYYLSLAKHPKVVAIGECGFDYFHMPFSNSSELENEKSKQADAFMAQIKLAQDVGKPLMLHCRSSADKKLNAYRDVISSLKTAKYKPKNASGIAHFFSGSIDEAKELLELGFYFTFGGAITLPPRANGADFESLIKMMPEDRIMCETDAPYVAPLKYRGKRNEPVYIEEAIKKLAEFRRISISDIEKITLENTRKVLNLTF